MFISVQMSQGLIFHNIFKAYMNNKKTKKIIPAILLIFMLLPPIFLFNIQKANAIVPVADMVNNPKEQILDTVGWMAAKTVIRQFTTGIVNWINTGFEGNPVFITDFNAFLKDIANEATGIFIEELELTDLCSPFRPQLLAAFKKGKPYEWRMKCTLNDVVDNIEAFEKDFNAGGWKAWMSMTTQSQNNVYGAYLESLDELEAKKAAAMRAAEKEAEMGNGFMSMKVCASRTAKGSCKKWEITTPGKIIEGQLNETLGTDLRQLEIADELNEIAAAALNQMFTWVITGGTGGGGLRGTTGASVKTAAVDFEKIRRDFISEIDKTVNQEIVYRNIKQRSVDTLRDIKDTYIELQNYDKLDHATEISATDSKIVSLQNEVSKSNVLIDNLNFNRGKALTAADAIQLAYLSSDYVKLSEQARGHDQISAQNELDGYKTQLTQIEKTVSRYLNND